MTTTTSAQSTDSYSGSPRLDGRAALLAAARSELAEVGPGGLSLRAIARRAGVSHAAPKHHFADRAGLLTALAADGFSRLGVALRSAAKDAGPAPVDQLTALGRAYLDFGLADPTLFELMFRSELLHPDDPQLRSAQQAAFAALGTTVSAASVDQHLGNEQPAGALSLIAWAFVHGLVVLTRDGALQTVAATPTPVHTADLARSLTDSFTASLRADRPANQAGSSAISTIALSSRSRRSAVSTTVSRALS